MYLPRVKAAAGTAGFPHIHLGARSGFHRAGRLDIQRVGIFAIGADPGNHQKKGCGNLRSFSFRALDDKIHAVRLIVRSKIVGGEAMDVRGQDRYKVFGRPVILHSRFVR